MTRYEMLDRLLNGEPVDATEDVAILAELVEEVESVFTVSEPTTTASSRGLARAMDAFEEAVPTPAVPGRTRRMAARVLVAAAMAVLLPTAGWAASEDALPGDVLYPVKRAFEQLRLVVTFSPAGDAAVLLDQAAERLGEGVRARALGREDVVSAAVAGYEETMAAFGVRIDVARAEGVDVSGLLAVAHGMVERHQALLDAVLTGGQIIGHTPPAAAPMDGHAERDVGGGPQRQRTAKDEGTGDQGKARGKARGPAGGWEPGRGLGDLIEGRTGGDDLPDGERDGTSGDAVTPTDPPDLPGKADEAPLGRAEGHLKHGPPPHGKAGGQGRHADPQPQEAKWVLDRAEELRGKGSGGR